MVELAPEDKDKLLNIIENVLDIFHRTVYDGNLETYIKSEYRDLKLVPVFRESYRNSRDKLFLARIEILNATEELTRKLNEHDVVKQSLNWKEAVVRKDYEEYKSAN